MSDTPDSPAAARFTFRSDLDQTPLPEVLYTVWRHKVPGAIDCVHGEVRKSLFVDQGRLIFATSGTIEDSLGDRLLRSGRITPAQYRESVRRLVRESGKRQGVILVEMGALQPRELFIEVRDQVREIVWSLFEWDKGDVLFTPGRERHQEFIRLDIPLLEAVAEGVRRIPDARRLIAKLGTRSTVYERTAEPMVDPSTIDARLQELLAAVDGRRTLFDLASTPGGTPPDNTRGLYTLLVYRLIRPRPTTTPLKVRVRG